ncbi:MULTISPECIES: 5-formyltetrahydrofolate cyclo-ligase [Streptomyces]|uniref:5-formyltetrahydrofolate cyclo-ligase n=1 Tax=Streptomyces TaxID=1883 RepID=UPI0022489EA7|nr:5-formyltetrahydrofolate cyclo-ligase [Streptomyces sp. JHD 1]MCX2968167.1 5-formyltetrahydrofolate cyclo-ligase [Streptomyces sp. JHD 1]
MNRTDTGAAGAEKRALRRELLERRAGLPRETVDAAARALAAQALRLPELADAGTVAAYVSIGSEPGTRELLEALRTGGVRVLLPVLLPDNDLDWAEYTGPGALRAAGRGLWEPAGPRLGPHAVVSADAVLLPGLAVDAGGLRLGRGGGSYDRVLARLAAAGAAPALVVLVYAHELLECVPAEPHDRPVTAAITPAGVHRFG